MNVERVFGVAAELGFRELMPRTGVVDCIRGAQEQWEHAREVSRLDLV